MLNSINQNQSIGRINYPQNFRGDSPLVTNPNLTYPNDTVEIQGEVKTAQKKKGMSKAAKWTLGIGGTIAGLAAAGMLIMRHDSQKLAKLCKEKIKFTELPENLEYSAKTREEAIKFAKEVLGVKEVDEEFTEEALHWVNRSIVDVSNANKGKVFIPPKLVFANANENALASANLAIKTGDFGTYLLTKSTLIMSF